VLLASKVSKLLPILPVSGPFKKSKKALFFIVIISQKYYFELREHNNWQQSITTLTDTKLSAYRFGM
jgi:hypothetical protein